MRLIAEGKPGSGCPNGNAAVHKDEHGKPICAASRRFQKKALDELNLRILEPEAYEKEFNAITEPACICNSLTTAAMHAHGIEPEKAQGPEVAVCPGPAMAYFSEKVSLKRMVSHIYGKESVIKRTDRPNMFVKELSLYVDYLKDQLSEATKPFDKKQISYFKVYQENMQQGIDYYKTLVGEFKGKLEDLKQNFLSDIERFENEMNKLKIFKQETVLA